MLPDFAGINLFFIIALLIFSVGFASGGAVFKKQSVWILALYMNGPLTIKL
jgi:hypothetical protein